MAEKSFTAPKNRNLRKDIRELFPDRKNQLMAWGKLTLGALQITSGYLGELAQFGVFDSEEAGRRRLQREQRVVLGIVQWTIDGDRCAPEFREEFVASFAELQLATAAGPTPE